MTNRFSKATILTLGLALALPVSGRVVVSEIAWMGTTDSSSAEWIELQNIGPDNQSLDGWILEAADGSPTIPLSGNLAVGEFFILERTGDTALPGITADLIYTGALGNSGENLQLRDGSGTLMDSLDFASGWPAGDNDTKDTMQRTDSGWTTAAPTPRLSSLTVTAQNLKEATATTTPTSTVAETPKSPVAAPTVLDMHGKLNVPTTTLAGQHIQITGELWNGEQHLPYSELRVNFGDGEYKHVGIMEPLYHRYLTPGTYLVRYQLRSQPWKLEADSAGNVSIAVMPANFWVRPQGTGIALENRAELSLDVSGWVLAASSGDTFRLPPLSIMEPGGELTLSSPSLEVDLARFMPTQIIDQDGVSYPIQSLALVPGVPEPTPALTATRRSSSIKPTTPPPTQEISDEPVTQPQDLIFAAASQAPLIQKSQAPLWPWFGLGLLILSSLGLFGFIILRQPQRVWSKPSDPQLDLFQE